MIPAHHDFFFYHNSNFIEMLFPFIFNSKEMAAEKLNMQ